MKSWEAAGKRRGWRGLSARSAVPLVRDHHCLRLRRQWAQWVLVKHPLASILLFIHAKISNEPAVLPSRLRTIAFR